MVGRADRSRNTDGQAPSRGQPGRHGTAPQISRRSDSLHHLSRDLRAEARGQTQATHREKTASSRLEPPFPGGSDAELIREQWDQLVRIASGLRRGGAATFHVSWPKVRRGLVAFRKAVTEGEGGSEADRTASLFEILSDPTPARDDELPDTGIGRELERVLSPLFVRTPVYGTRVSTVVLLRRDGGATFVERTFAPDGGEPSTSTYRFQIGG